MARPTIYSQELADRICEELAMGKSMRTVCKQDDMPAMATVFRWLREKEKFKEQYARAKEEASDALVEEIQDIADDGTNDYMEMQDGENLNAYRFMGEHVQRSKLRVEARKWIASKQKPKKYGEKMDFTSGGERISGFADLVKEANGQDDGESDSGDTGEDTD